MQQLRVVVVDDHPIYRRGLVGVLESGGIAVVGVADGVTDAISVVEATQPDAVLVDLYLADGSGIALACVVITYCVMVTLWVMRSAAELAMFGRR